MDSLGTPSTETHQATRRAITSVLPEPAPATTNMRFLGELTAAWVLVLQGEEIEMGLLHSYLSPILASGPRAQSVDCSHSPSFSGVTFILWTSL